MTAGIVPMAGGKPTRGAVYVDGFNLYHAINDLGKPHLKWYDLWKLSETIIRGRAHPLTRVVFCTAFRKGDTGKKARHRAFVDALEIRNVHVEHGHEVQEPTSCPSCNHAWEIPREKATDINLALRAYEDGCADLYDTAFIVSADTDQAATFAFLKRRFPEKQFITVAPPGRTLSQHLYNIAHGKFILTEKHIDDAVLPGTVTDGSGRYAHCPFEYSPPNGWVHPSDRP